MSAIEGKATSRGHALMSACTEGVIDFWGSPNWTWKIEGLYMDLGTLHATGVTSGIFTGPDVYGVAGGGLTTHSHFTDGILRAGLNYKFY